MSPDLKTIIVLASVLGALVVLVCIWLVSVMVLHSTSLLGAVNYTFIPVLVPLYCLWQESRFVRRAKRMPPMRSDTIAGPPEPYTWTRRSLGNELITFGWSRSRYSEYHCDRWIFNDIPYGGSKTVVGFILSKPYGPMKFNGIENMPLTAEPRESQIGQHFDIGLDYDRCRTYKPAWFSEGLKFCLENAGYDGYKLLMIYQFGCTLTTITSEADVARRLGEAFDLICHYLRLRCEFQVPFSVEGSPLVPENVKGYDPIITSHSVFNERRDVVCVGVIKMPCLFRVNSRNYLTKNDLFKRYIRAIIKQLLMSMIAKSVRFGYTCDSYFLVLIELEEDESFYKNEFGVFPDEETGLPRFRVPSNTFIVNVNSTGPSFFVALLVFIYMAQQAKIDTAVSPIFQYFKRAYQPVPRTVFADEDEVTGFSTSSEKSIAPSFESNSSAKT